MYNQRWQLYMLFSVCYPEAEPKAEPVQLGIRCQPADYSSCMTNVTEAWAGEGRGRRRLDYFYGERGASAPRRYLTQFSCTGGKQGSEITADYGSSDVLGTAHTVVKKFSAVLPA